MHKPNVFAGAYLDRNGHLRQDPTWFEAALNDVHSRAVPVWNARSLIIKAPSPRADLIRIGDLKPEHRNADHLVLLGRRGDRHLFAYDADSDTPPELSGAGRFEDLRWVAAHLPAEEAGLLAYAGAMISWRRSHKFCGVCGFPTRPAKSGHTLICTNAPCQHEQFPRLDPAIIVLISDGDRALLGRQASWPAGRYSTIAGFVEPGESLEDAVAREILEETGIQVDSITYQSSQPWPFPSSLMLGFSAHAISTDIQLNDRELEEARWFSRADIAAGHPRLPPNPSISYRLIEQWFDAGGGHLSEVQGNSDWPRTD